MLLKTLAQPYEQYFRELKIVTLGESFDLTITRLLQHSGQAKGIEKF